MREKFKYCVKKGLSNPTTSFNLMAFSCVMVSQQVGLAKSSSFMINVAFLQTTTGITSSPAQTQELDASWNYKEQSIQCSSQPHPAAACKACKHHPQLTFLHVDQADVVKYTVS